VKRVGPVGPGAGFLIDRIPFLTGSPAQSAAGGQTRKFALGNYKVFVTVLIFK